VERTVIAEDQPLPGVAALALPAGITAEQAAETQRVAQEIPIGDIEPLVNAAFAEEFAGYRREMMNGNWVWKQGDSDIRRMARLTSVREVGWALGKSACEMCDFYTSSEDYEQSNSQLLFACNTMRQLPGEPRQYMAQFTIFTPPPEGELPANWPRNAEGQPTPLILRAASAKAQSPGVAIALAMLNQHGTDLAKKHREIFPHRYLAKA